MILTADRVVLPTGSVEPGWVETSGERITGAGGHSPPAPAARHLPGTLVPGFVDQHCHGGGGASFTTGDPSDAARVVATHRAHGTTSLVASLVTDTSERLESHVKALAPLVRAGELVGLHLEGPWLSSRHCGAHDPALLRAPDREEVVRILDAADGTVRMVTLAPELDHGLDTVRLLRERGVVAALGHTDARFDLSRSAIDAGVTVGTHLFNAMRGVHHREPGPVLALAGDRRVVVELIADGIHLHPEVLHWAATSTPGRFALVTDAMGAAGAADGDYVLGPAAVQVRDRVARLTDGGAIAGSTLTMDRALRYAVTVAGVPLDLAVEASSSTPARVLGLTDVGALAAGRRADLVHLDDELEVIAVMRAGAWLSPTS
ncbi:N-acetylglucosamine-6-phosphate deacetylase [Oryzobacter terrae]|uniref:N-acetylglucosamine-6-phosphate deacetylase n=1 Tax=Oryzobacter terrae TaxID=1620385 RepID=UPI00366BC0EC